MAAKRTHKRMTSDEQARRSEDLYSSSASYYAQAAAPVPVGTGTQKPKKPTWSKRKSGYDAPTRNEGAAETYAARRRKKGRGRVLRVVLVLLAVLVVGAGVAAAAYLANLDEELSSGVTEEVRAQLVATDESEPFYMLILGVDKSEARASSWGSDSSNFRADTIILARIDAQNQTVTLVSIPRDTMVDMGDYGTQKINAAYTFGGAAYMIEIVSELAGVDISHYAEMDFEGFTAIVDLIGGIEVTLEIDVVDEDYAGINLTAGTYTLDGTTALALVRTRHAYDSYGAGDYYRAANQRMVIGAIISKILSLDVATITSVVTEAASYLTTDYTSTEILSLAMQFLDFDVDSGFYSGQLPTYSAYIDSLWYEVVEEDEWAEMMERVEAGLSPYESVDDDPTADATGGVGTYTGDVESTDPVYSGTVLVLNGTTTSGLALSTANDLIDVGFTATADNADSTDVQESAIVYNSGYYYEALGVAYSLGFDDTILLENDGTYSTAYDVVAILGADFVEDDE